MVTRPDYPEPISKEFKNLLQRSLLKDPTQRITLDQLFEHAFITKIGTRPLFRVHEESITVTAEDIQRAISKKQIETNLFAVAKVKASFTRAQTRQSIRLSNGLTIKEPSIGVLPNNDD